MNPRSWLLLFWTVVVAGTAGAGEAQPLSPEDLWAERLIGQVTVSPGGRNAAYVLSTIDRARNEYVRRIYEVSTTTGGVPVQLTHGYSEDTEPAYSPDGKWLAFLSDRDGTNRVYLLRRQGGEPFVPFRLDSDASAISWSPDSTRLCFLAQVPSPKPETDVLVIDRYRYRIDGVGYLGAQEEQLYEGNIANGQVQKLTEGMFSLADPRYSPDGSTVLFTANVTPDHDFNYNTDICAVPSGGGKVARLTTTAEGESRPQYSPDGGMIAYVRARRPNDYYASNDLWVMTASGSNQVDLTGRFDRNVGLEGYEESNLCAPRWSADGKYVYILLQTGPDTALYRCAPARRGRPEPVMQIAGQIEYPFPVDNGRRLVHGRQYSTAATELCISNLDGSQSTRLTFHQQERLKDRWISTPEKIPIRSADGTPIDGWIIKPPLFDPFKKYPLILDIHGGPAWYYGNIFYAEKQVWAAQGWIVLYTNPRGSTGYGQAFIDSIKADWGNLDYKDMMAAVDAAVATGYVDERRMGVTGLSYGGILTNWIVGHTDRFRAAVSEEGLSNFSSSYGTDDCQIDWEHELGLPWENESLYRRLSPLTYAREVKTPILIIHGEDDFRTAIDQAEQWFVTLKRLGKDVLFLRYPRESHEWRGSGEPLHRYDRMKRVLAWWKRYLDESQDKSGR